MNQRPATWHLVTSEYPPAIGGVSDHSLQIAEGLAAEGCEVHVWTRRSAGLPVLAVEGEVHVHRELSAFSLPELRRLSSLLGRTGSPRRILAQWVPHGFGFASMNLLVCFWLAKRSAAGDSVEVVVHEPGLPFSFRNPRWNLPALVHRMMAAVLIRSSDRIWVSAPMWETRWRPYALGATTPFEWLPLPTGIPLVRNEEEVRALGKSIPGGQTVGYFGLAQAGVSTILERWVRAILENTEATIVLIGKGGEEMKKVLTGEVPHAGERIFATGVLDSREVSLHLQACDVMIQPYEGGANARRSSLVTTIAHGRAVVTTTGRFTEDLWKDGSVSLVAEEDTGAALRCVATLLKDESRRHLLGEAAASLYDAHFSLTRVVSRLLDTPRLD